MAVYTALMRVAYAYTCVFLLLSMVHMWWFEIPQFAPIWDRFVIAGWTGDASADIHDSWGNGLVMLLTLPAMVLVFGRTVLEIAFAEHFRERTLVPAE